MTKIITLSGISASGKSTWTRNKIKEYPNFIAVSRDKIRELLFGYTEESVESHYNAPNFKELEKLVSTFQITNMRQAIAQGFDIIIDNTHLDKKYIDDMLKEFPQCDFEFVLLEIDVDIAIERDMARTRKVGRNVITRQFIQLQNLKKNFDFKPIFSNFIKINYDETLPNCIICDLDGTIADFSATRSAYGFDANLIRFDKAIDEVLDVINNSYYRDGVEIIFLSGREDKYYNETLEWIYNNTVLRHENIILFMRKSNDFRKDNIIKKEIFEVEIRNKYNVKLAIDDRNSIVSLWQSLGIFVLNVNQTGKEF